MQVLDDDIREITPEDESIIRKLKIESIDILKDVRNGRVAIIFMIVLTVLGAVMGYFFRKEDWFYIAIEAIILIAVYAWAAWYFPTGPKVALIVASSLFVLHALLTAVAEPSSLVKGLIVKLILVYFLAKVLHSSFRFEQMQAKFRQYGQDLRI